jgi:hypothetical protein
MKTKLLVFLIVFVGMTFISCKQNAADKIEDSEVEYAKERDRLAKAGFPEMTFTSTEYDFGKVTEGDKVSGFFEYTNTGKSDLVITSVTASCGCTVPEYDKDKALKPGEKGTIKFIFDTTGKPENQHKTITIRCNTKKEQETVQIKGYVNPKKSIVAN